MFLCSIVFLVFIIFFSNRIREENCIVSSFIISTVSNIIGLIQSRRMSYVGHVTCLGEVSNAYKILIRKFGWPGDRWEGNIKIEHRVRKCGLRV
jgi:hypothetical protein